MFWETSRPLSHRRSSIRCNAENRNSLNIRSKSEVDFEETSFGEDLNRSRGSMNRSRSPVSRSSLKKRGSVTSAQRKSVSFKELFDEKQSRDSVYSSNRKSLKKSRRSSSKNQSPSFGANNSIVDDTADFEELEFVDSIPTEGKRSILRSSGFSATKDKTNRSHLSFVTPNKLNFGTLSKDYR